MKLTMEFDVINTREAQAVQRAIEELRNIPGAPHGRVRINFVDVGDVSCIDWRDDGSGRDDATEFADEVRK